MNYKSNMMKLNLTKNSFNIFSMIIAFFSSSFLWFWNIGPYWDEGYFAYMTLILIGFMFCVIYWIFVKMYDAHGIGQYRLTELTYFQLLSFFFADLTLFIEMIFWFHGTQRLRFWTFLVIFMVQIVSVAALIFVHNRIYMRYAEPLKVILIYGSDNYEVLLKKFKGTKNRYKVVGAYSEKEDIERLKLYIDEADCVYLYEVNDSLRRQMILYCDSCEKTIHMSQCIEDWISMAYDISHTFDTPFIRTKHSAERWYYGFVKRLVDVVCSGLGLLVLSPVFLVVAICIKAYDKGPVFYKQVRLTKGHKEFEICKFRSMIVDAEKNGAKLALQNDSRITPIGKIIRATRIDELPQLINILKGDMTIVGPRPERPEIEAEYLKELPEFGLRLKVKAGLTGYAQVFGKYNTTPEDKLKLDLLYINNRSVLLDFKLIFYTLKIIFMPESTEGFEEDGK